ncbi:hypothetical protein VSR34_05895 [Paraburkholderia sp. JHI2823]|uniref:hypothetical protein n=1 Tax=Paraburkholderia TaxID=1822464 RepID=UPI0003F6D944|nr:hypothetical protein [Paraburkholderia mimosarum]
MYLVGDYFVECLTNHIPRDGWAGAARITRRDDWKKPAEVPKALFVGLPDCPTKREAEQAAIRWARERVLKHRDIIEKALEDGCFNGAAEGRD